MASDDGDLQHISLGVHGMATGLNELSGTGSMAYATVIRVGKRVLGLVYVVQFAICCWLYSSGSGTPRSSSLLHFSDQHVDLGTVAAGSELSVNISLENRSAVVQKVLRFESTCGCTVPKTGGSFLIEPGETKAVPFVVKPSAGGRMRNAIICVFDNGAGQLCRTFAIIEGDVAGENSNVLLVPVADPKFGVAGETKGDTQ